MKITGKTKVCSLLKMAANKATGKGVLVDGNDNCCLWGEAAFMVGVSKNQMSFCLTFGTNNELRGMNEWDSGHKIKAISKACSEKIVGSTVGSFRRFLKKSGYDLGKIMVS